MKESVEEESQIPVEQLGFPSDVSQETISKIKDLLDALAHEDAIKIFLYAKDGITNSTEAIKKLRLTQKRYYTRLKLLLDAGILEKWEEGYRYTFLGNIVYQMSRSFKNLIEHKDRLELADKLRKTKNLSLEEKKDIMKLITPTETGELDLSDLVSPVRMMDNYEDLVKNLIEIIDKSEESICLASKYSDVRAVEAIVRALQRGVNIRALSGEKGMTDRINMLRALLSPRMLGAILKAAKELSTNIRKTNVNYSFMIVDEKWAVIEIPHPTKDIFYIGFVFQNVGICKRLSSIFNEMWEKAEGLSLL